MDAKLQKAVELFKKHGWENVTAENILDLPVGTAEEKKIALDGLKSGWWSDTVQKGNTFTHRNFFKDDYKGKLALFAIRVGVTASRAADITRISHVSEDALYKIVENRGAKFAGEFVTRLGAWGWFNGKDEFIMRVMNEMNLPVPQNENYLNAWTTFAASTMNLENRYGGFREKSHDVSIIKKRFAEHIRAGAALNIPAAGEWGFAKLTTKGVESGYLEREETIELIFSALDAAVRPADRAAWITALDDLELQTEEYLSRIQSIIPMLSTGDNAVISKLAPILIKDAPSELLTEVLLAAFSAQTKKAKKMLLKAALQRDCPPNAEELSPWLSIFAGDTDKSISSLSAKLADKWQTGVEEFPEYETEIMGLWQETPPVWEVPRFEIGEVSPEMLTELASEILSLRAADWGDDTHDVVMERFLAMVNAVAYKNPEEARNALRGLKSRDSRLINIVVRWVKGEKNIDGSDAQPYYGEKCHAPLPARDYMVSSNFGKIPYFLSTPSKDDLTITVPDLVSRLALYAETNTDALEADLYLALARLDVKTATPQAREELANIKVFIRLQSGETLKISKMLIRRPLTAGQAILNYLNNPIPEPRLSLDKSGYWRPEPLNVKKSFEGFPDRMRVKVCHEKYFTLPCFGDYFFHEIYRHTNDASHVLGRKMRQAARRGEPFSPAVAINFLAGMRSPSQHAAADASLAVREAWERGLLRPGVADIKYLDWYERPPAALAALATALDGIARDGILSVVWDVLDKLVGASIAAPKILTGTAEIAQVILTFLPEVQLAIEKNIAPASALNLPNTRALAKRKGSSQAVSTAKKISELLPEVQGEVAETPVVVAETQPFEKVWLLPKKIHETIQDGAIVSVDWDDAKKTRLLFSITVQGYPDKIFYFTEQHGLWSIEYKNYITVTPAKKNEPYKRFSQEDEWLYWDTEKNTLSEGKSHKNPAKLPPRPAVIYTVLIGLLSHDGYIKYTVPRLLMDFIKGGYVSAETVRGATQMLLQSPAISPAKIVRVLEKEIEFLSALWPALTESIKFAGEIVATGGKIPAWVNRVLDIALFCAPHMKEAAKRGLIPDAQWQGLQEIANSNTKSAAVEKAKALCEQI